MVNHVDVIIDDIGIRVEILVSSTMRVWLLVRNICDDGDRESSTHTAISTSRTLEFGRF